MRMICLMRRTSGDRLCLVCDLLNPAYIWLILLELTLTFLLSSPRVPTENRKKATRLQGLLMRSFGPHRSRGQGAPRQRR